MDIKLENTTCEHDIQYKSSSEADEVGEVNATVECGTCGATYILTVTALNGGCDR